MKNILFKLSEIEKFWEKDYVIDFIKSIINNPSFNKSRQKGELMNNEYIKSFIFEDIEKCNIYLHYTSSEDISKKIIKEGFRFIDSLHKTSEQISLDEVELVYKHNLRKLYGNYVIVICISKTVTDFYYNELKKVDKNDAIGVEQVLTEVPSIIDDNSEEIFVLSNKFIKGYFNHITGEIINNTEFNPNFKSKKFLNNI